MHPVVDFPLDLARKYNRPGPRYTSYPTAPRFHQQYGRQDFIADLAVESTSDEPLSLYLHLPFCRSLCNYCGCHMMVTHRPEKISAYVDVLMREIENAADRLGTKRSAIQVHWGGGTPTYLAPEEIEQLMNHVAHAFNILPEAEVSIEADPRGLTREHVDAARRSGFNRISFGIQDLDPGVQAAIGRIQPLELVADVTEWARHAGFDGLSYDLIYGLPLQTRQTFAETTERIIDLNPDRLSVFSYAHVPWLKKHQTLIDETTLPPAEEKLLMLVNTSQRLVEAGYDFVGMDHFARPEDSLAEARRQGTMQRNFQGYSTHAGHGLLGFGTSSISQLDGAYAQNEKDLRTYYEAVESNEPPVYRGYRLTEEDRLRREVIMSIMCRFELSERRIEEQFGVRFREHFANVLDFLPEFTDDGLIIQTDDGFVVTETGRYFVRNIAMPFDGYLTDAGSGPRYSRTI